MAQKTAVISALESLAIGTSRTHVRTMYHSLKTEIVPKKIILSKEIDDNNIIEAARTESLLQSRHYPEWVRTLYNLGIESSSISVEFKESHTTLYSKEIFSRSCKTLLCCVLKILQRNLEVSVISKPYVISPFTIIFPFAISFIFYLDLHSQKIPPPYTHIHV